MAKLQIDFYGMALLREGADRAEAWLIDTAKVDVRHAHMHHMRIGTRYLPLQDGVLVSFEQGGAPMHGKVTVAHDAQHLVDLDHALENPVLRPELLVKDPAIGGEWKSLLAAWIRLPGGSYQPRPLAGETWTFPRGGPRVLSETASLYAPVKDEPLMVRLSWPDGREELVNVPTDHGRHILEISTEYTNEHGPSTVPQPGVPLPLDEVLLLYACVTPGPIATVGPQATATLGAKLPTRVFTQDEIDLIRARIPESDPVTICPGGRKRFP